MYISISRFERTASTRCVYRGRSYATVVSSPSHNLDTCRPDASASRPSDTSTIPPLVRKSRLSLKLLWELKPNTRRPIHTSIPGASTFKIIVQHNWVFNQHKPCIVAFYSIACRERIRCVYPQGALRKRRNSSVTVTCPLAYNTLLWTQTHKALQRT